MTVEPVEPAEHAGASSRATAEQARLEGSGDVGELTLLAHRAAVAHLEACQEAEWGEDGEDREDYAEVDSPAVAPYCGCTDCEVREILHAAWPLLRAAVIAELAAEGRLLPASATAAEAVAHGEPGQEPGRTDVRP